MSTPPGWNAPPPGWDQPPQQWQQQWQQHWQPPVEDTTWAVLAHLSFFAFGLIAPLVIYLVKKDESAFTRHHAAEALNFHLTLLIATIASVVLMLVLVGFVTYPLVVVAAVVIHAIAALKAHSGEWYDPPFTIRFVR